MRPTDPRELLHPVLPAETYRRLGIAPPRPPQQYAPGGPVSSAGTPFLTGRAVTGAPAPTAPGPGPHPPGPRAPGAAAAPSGPMAHAGGTGVAADPHPPAYVPAGPTGRGGPPQRDRSVAIVVTAAALIIAIIIGATWYILAHRSSDDERQIRDVIAAETTALNNRDLSALIGTRCAADVQQLQRQFSSQTFAAEIDGMLGPGGRWEVTVGEVRIDADAGTATAEERTVPINGAGSGPTLPQTVTDTATLRKESGGWKVCVSTSQVR